jgi:hypothetical protein
MKTPSYSHFNQSIRLILFSALLLFPPWISGCARTQVEDTANIEPVEQHSEPLPSANPGAVAAVPHRAQPESPPLKPGDAAPPLQVSKWLQGEPEDGLGSGKGYLIVFWATWCRQSLQCIPRLNEVHERYEDKDLVVIGQNVWESDPEQVAPFIEALESRMKYRVALDDTTREEQGAMAVNWMEAAHEDRVPMAFLVNREGRIAWMGHPMALEETMIDLFLKHPLPPALSREELERHREIERQSRFWFWAMHQAIGTDTVQVELRDGEMTVSPARINGGDRGATFEVVNAGSEPHELIIVRKPAPPRELPIENDRVRYWAADMPPLSPGEIPPPFNPKAMITVYYYGDPNFGGGTAAESEPGLGQLAAGERKTVLIAPAGGPGPGVLLLFCNFPGHYQRGEHIEFVIQPREFTRRPDGPRPEERRP